ncbi:hypothetical protein H4Q26_009481 [Puccinia striiformis f. sp. tritici PST-130]|nr:hypothetical protein H4Q26_009481 [Puccinia striiformis f. sp. tritici PST-130]
MADNTAINPSVPPNPPLSNNCWSYVGNLWISKPQSRSSSRSFPSIPPPGSSARRSSPPTSTTTTTTSSSTSSSTVSPSGSLRLPRSVLLRSATLCRRGPPPSHPQHPQPFPTTSFPPQNPADSSEYLEPYKLADVWFSGDSVQLAPFLRDIRNFLHHRKRFFASEDRVIIWVSLHFGHCPSENIRAHSRSQNWFNSLIRENARLHGKLTPYADFERLAFVLPALASWDVFEEGLIKFFGDKYHMDTAKAALDACRQGSMSVEDYNTQFSSLKETALRELMELVIEADKIKGVNTLDEFSRFRVFFEDITYPLDSREGGSDSDGLTKIFWHCLHLELQGSIAESLIFDGHMILDENFHLAELPHYSILVEYIYRSYISLDYPDEMPTEVPFISEKQLPNQSASLDILGMEEIGENGGQNISEEYGLTLESDWSLQPDLFEESKGLNPSSTSSQSTEAPAIPAKSPAMKNQQSNGSVPWIHLNRRNKPETPPQLSHCPSQEEWNFQCHLSEKFTEEPSAITQYLDIKELEFGVEEQSCWSSPPILSSPPPSLPPPTLSETEEELPHNQPENREINQPDIQPTAPTPITNSGKEPCSDGAISSETEEFSALINNPEDRTYLGRTLAKEYLGIKEEFYQAYHQFSPPPKHPTLNISEQNKQAPEDSVTKIIPESVIIQTMVYLGKSVLDYYELTKKTPFHSSLLRNLGDDVWRLEVNNRRVQMVLDGERWDQEYTITPTERDTEDGLGEASDEDETEIGRERGMATIEDDPGITRGGPPGPALNPTITQKETALRELMELVIEADKIKGVNTLDEFSRFRVFFEDITYPLDSREGGSDSDGLTKIFWHCLHLELQGSIAESLIFDGHMILDEIPPCRTPTLQYTGRIYL